MRYRAGEFCYTLTQQAEETNERSSAKLVAWEGERVITADYAISN